MIDMFLEESAASQRSASGIKGKASTANLEKSMSQLQLMTEPAPVVKPLSLTGEVLAGMSEIEGYVYNV
jgi:hypothetical protein